MKFCSKCGKELLDEAVICPNCGCSVVEPLVPQENYDDQISVGLCILAALIPLFGFIYWPVKHKEVPKRAQACGITALVACIINFVIIL